jgi:hypothetical protein
MNFGQSNAHVVNSFLTSLVLALYYIFTLSGEREKQTRRNGNLCTILAMEKEKEHEEKERKKK